MTHESVIELVRNALTMVLLISAPVLGVSLIVGLIISIFQTTTSIQEQTLTFVPKIIAIFLILMIFAGWIIMNLTNYTKLLWLP